MIEEMKSACIRVQSCTHEWMDCIFLVEEKDKKKAIRVLERAWDDFWYDGEAWCYVDFMMARLEEAGIQSDAYYAQVGKETVRDQQKQDKTSWNCLPR